MSVYVVDVDVLCLSSLNSIIPLVSPLSPFIPSVFICPLMCIPSCVFPHVYSLMCIQVDASGGQPYSAAAMSLVLHPKHPMVPTLRGDVRVFEVCV